MKSGLKKSLALHLAVLLLFMIKLPMFWWNKTPAGQVPIIVDLQDIKISEMTNLPPKAKFGEEDKAATIEKRKIEENYTKDEPATPKEEVKEEPKKPEPKAEEKAPEEPKKSFMVAPQPKKPVVKPKPKPKPEKKPEKKTEPKKEQPKKSEPQLANPLKSLLASVDKLAQEADSAETATIKDGTKVANMGVEGGTIGSYFSELSISEMDALAGRLRQCWNLDPGAMGIEDMVIEIKAALNQNGTVRAVEVMDKSRYNTDGHFRSVANSAVRAVHICEPVYKEILAEKYADRYDKWQVLRLRFNPIDKSIR